MNNGFSSDLMGKTINISTLVSDVMPSTVRGIQILSLLDPMTARSFSDVAATHASYEPYIQGWVPGSWKEQNYLKVQHLNGNVEYLGTSWLDFSTVEIQDNSKTEIVLRGTTPEDTNRIRTVLIKAGYTEIESIRTVLGGQM